MRHKKVVLVITSCGHCPFFNDHHFTCDHPNTKVDYIDLSKIKTFPNKCPIESYEVVNINKP